MVMRRCSGGRGTGLPSGQSAGVTPEWPDEILDLARQAEVDDAHAAVGADEHVVGLEVAVHEAGGVRGGEAAAGVAHDARRPRATARGVLSQRLSVCPRRTPSRRTPGSRRCRRRRPATTLGCESRASACASRTRRCLPSRAEQAEAQQLERDLAIELGIVGEVDHAHAALPHRRDEHVAPDAIAGAQPAPHRWAVAR